MSTKTTNNLTIDNLKMPTKINIGDITHNLQPSNIENDFYFSRSFKCKTKWVGFATLKKVNIKTSKDAEIADYLTLIYAPTKKLLNLYKENSIYDCQKIKNTELLTSSMKFEVKINDTNFDFQLKNPGLFGDILEVYRSTNKLEGLIINIYIGNNNNFEEIASKLSEQQIELTHE